MKRGVIFGAGLLIALGVWGGQSQQQKKLAPNDADVAFVASMAESAAKQYNAMTPAQKSQVEAKVAKLVPKDANAELTIQALRAYCERSKKGVTTADKAAIRAALNEYPSWCAAVKATRIGRQGMAKLGIPCKELSIQDMLNLVPN